MTTPKANTYNYTSTTTHAPERPPHAAPHTQQTSSLPSRPANATRTSSSNYATAAATAAAGRTTSGAGVNDDGRKAETASGATAAAWRPRMDRDQSWSEQDWKRKVEMDRLTQIRDRQGFSSEVRLAGEEGGS